MGGQRQPLDAICGLPCGNEGEGPERLCRQPWGQALTGRRPSAGTQGIPKRTGSPPGWVQPGVRASFRAQRANLG
jgi:hypothetical protein